MTFSIVPEPGLILGRERRDVIVVYSIPVVYPVVCRIPSLSVHFPILRFWFQTPSLCSSVAGPDLWVLLGAALQTLLLNLWILRLAFLPILPTLFLPFFPPPQ